MKKIIFLFTILILLIGIDAEALITVKLSGGDHNNFQDAIDAATGTETILVSNGTYTGVKNRDITIDKEGINLTIESENGAGVCIIDAQGLDRVIGLLNVNGSDSVVLRGFTIKNGDDSTFGGGGIYNHNSVLTVENCIIINNTSDEGGGIRSGGSAGSLTMSNCFILDNTSNASSSGGGIHIANMQVTVTNCVFSNNSVISPGMHGGCMYITNYGDASFTNCLFESNSAYGSGGLFFNANSDVSFTNCTVVGNRCTANGGVGFIAGTSISPATVTLKNCIFDGNIANGLSNLFRLSGIYVGDAVLNYSYSNLDPSEIGGIGGTINDLGNNINADPMFGTAGYWDTGNWIPGDYHLMSKVGRWSTKSWVIDESHSPCIDTGDVSDSYALEPTPNGSRINMGYYGNTGEASKSPYCGMTLLADINGDCYVDIYDFAIIAQEWLMCDIQPSSFCWQ